MRSYKEQVIEPVTASDILSKARDRKAEGYRLVQICATKVSEGFEILYSFDKDHELSHLKLTIPEEEEVQSITGEYWGAFIYENEMHDLFGTGLWRAFLQTFPAYSMESKELGKEGRG